MHNTMTTTANRNWSFQPTAWGLLVLFLVMTLSSSQAAAASTEKWRGRLDTRGGILSLSINVDWEAGGKHASGIYRTVARMVPNDPSRRPRHPYPLYTRGCVMITIDEDGDWVVRLHSKLGTGPFPCLGHAIMLHGRAIGPGTIAGDTWLGARRIGRFRLVD